MSADDRPMPRDYPSLLAEIKERIRSAQYDALRAVNKELVALYWDLGRVICKRQADGTSWGKAVVERLAADLRAEFPGIFVSKPLVHAAVLPRLLRPRKTPTAGWRNQLGQAPGHSWQMQEPPRTRVLHPHDEKVRMVQERSYPSNRKSELREDSARPDELRQGPDAKAARTGKAGR